MKNLNCTKTSLDKEALNNLPSTPGVYQFIKNKKPIYIGKSINLKARIKSHKQNTKLDKKEKAIWQNTDHIKYTTVDTDFKALVLETSLIQKHQPRYNAQNKDDKSYLYIAINPKSTLPIIKLVRGRDIKTNKNKDVLYFGPFPSENIAKSILKQIRKLIPFHTQKITKKPCFYSKIDLCNPCPSKINPLKNKSLKKSLTKQYNNQIRQVISILNGNTEPVIKRLKNKMKSFSSEKEYEKALKVKNNLEEFQKWIDTHSFSKKRTFSYNQSEKRITSLKNILKKHYPNLNSLKRIECYDASTFQLNQSTASMIVLTNGKINKSQYRHFKIKSPNSSSDFSMLQETISRRFKNPWPKPNLIIIDGGKPQLKAVQKITDKLEQDIPIIGIAKAPDRLILSTNQKQKTYTTIKPKPTNQGFNLIKLARNEAHRFAHSYHLKLRNQIKD